MSRNRKLLLPLMVCLLIFAFGSLPVNAVTGCNSGGCWNATVKLIKVQPDGRIYFVVDNSAALNNLVPVDGCQVRTLWTGEYEPALFISTDDEERFEKYNVLLLAFATGQTISFGPVKTAVNNDCRLDYLVIRQP